MFADITSISSIIEKLRLSPLFNLSLASKELFHSNFLAWLCEKYPDRVGKVFALFVNKAPDKFDRVKVYRESHHIDLTLRYENDERLLIENKVKSLPSKEQLQEISDGVKERDRFFVIINGRPGNVHVVVEKMSEHTTSVAFPCRCPCNTNY